MEILDQREVIGEERSDSMGENPTVKEILDQREIECDVLIPGWSSEFSMQLEEQQVEVELQALLNAVPLYVQDELEACNRTVFLQLLTWFYRWWCPVDTVRAGRILHFLQQLDNPIFIGRQDEGGVEFVELVCNFSGAELYALLAPVSQLDLFLGSVDGIDDQLQPTIVLWEDYRRRGFFFDLGLHGNVILISDKDDFNAIIDRWTKELPAIEAVLQEYRGYQARCIVREYLRDREVP